MEHIAMIEIPLEKAQAFRDLLVAAKNWRSCLIPNTGTAVWSAVAKLQEAIAVFDPPPCGHPRATQVFHTDQSTACGRCGAPMSSAWPRATVPSPPEGDTSERPGPAD